MRIFKNKSFIRFAIREAIEDEDLLEAIECANNGLISADLGGGIKGINALFTRNNWQWLHS